MAWMSMKPAPMRIASGTCEGFSMDDRIPIPDDIRKRLLEMTQQQRDTLLCMCIAYITEFLPDTTKYHPR